MTACMSKLRGLGSAKSVRKSECSLSYDVKTRLIWFACRGLPVEDLTRLQILIAYWGFGLHWGKSTLWSYSCPLCEACMMFHLMPRNLQILSLSCMQVM